MNGVRKALEEAEYFYRRMQETESVPEQFRYNLNAFLSRARSVTWVLRKNYSKNPRFNEWYVAKKKQMERDELMKFFVDARNVSLKEEPIQPATSAYIRHIEIREAPKGRGFAITAEGEPVWIEKDETGKEKRVHASEFDSEVARQYYFDKPRPPSGFENLQVLDLCGLYVLALKDLVEEASRISEGENRKSTK